VYETSVNYFVTGATGFIGRHLITNLLKRKGTIYVLVRKGSEKKFEHIAETMGWDRKRVLPVAGDLAKAKLGVPAANGKGVPLSDLSSRSRILSFGTGLLLPSELNRHVKPYQAS